MSKKKIIDISFKEVICALEVLDSYNLSLWSIGKQSEISRDHRNIKDKIHSALIESNQPKGQYLLEITHRECAYLRKIVFQHFIALLKEGIFDHEKSYHSLYIELNKSLGKHKDEIQNVIHLISKEP